MKQPVPQIRRNADRDTHSRRMVQAAFVGGATGDWKVERLDAVEGATLPSATRLAVVPFLRPRRADAAWILRGVTSHERYVTRAEHERLASAQPPLGRPHATRAALIPIAKSADWWELPQDERRAVFEGDSHHVATGLEYLPPVARRLHHSLELGEPFDFLTWFEHASSDAPLFEQLVVKLRETREWDYVEREVDIRLAR